MSETRDAVTRKITDLYYVNFAKSIAVHSPDPSTKVGAILTTDNGELIGVGFNSFATKQCLDKADRFDRPLKYKWMIHAEINALANAASRGRSTTSSTIYIPFTSVPCTDCCKALIAAGVRRVVCLGDVPFSGKGEHWAEDIEISEMMLNEAGVVIDVVYPYNVEGATHEG